MHFHILMISDHLDILPWVEKEVLSAYKDLNTTDKEGLFLVPNGFNTKGII